MAHSDSGRAEQLATKVFRILARLFIKLHRPKIVVVAGSVGKTSTKLMLAKFLAAEKKVSYMDDSYNSGLGLYLSVFEQKVPKTTIFAWLGVLAKSIAYFMKHPEILVLEYGIDKPGGMDEMIEFAKPDYALLTAVTPEHMEFLKTIDIVGEEETKILGAAHEFGVVNAVDVDEKYLKDIQTSLHTYGNKNHDASFEVVSRSAEGSQVVFRIDGITYDTQKVLLVSDALIRQVSGALLMAQKLGVSSKNLEKVLPTIKPAAGRMALFEGVKGSHLIDDTANFSPVAGVVALQTLKKLEATRHIAILGNMHELGEFIEPGYSQVGEEFQGIDILVLIGELSKEHFGRIAKQKGFQLNENLFMFDSSPEAGAFVRDKIAKDGDVILLKGPFGGFYVEEATKKLLANKDDWVLLTRQSEFWQHKKAKHFGALLDL